MNLKTKQHLKTLLRGLLPMLLFFCFTITARASADTATLYLQGKLDYAKAYEALTYTNQLRAKVGRPALKMDKELLEAAMQRAAETQLYFSHTRPDGTLCFTASDRMYGENIAYGYSSASAVVTGWRNSSGHYLNMISPQFTSIGIGCFRQGNSYYWVQCFGTEPAVTLSRPANCTRTMAIQTDESLAGQCLMIKVPSNSTLAKNKTAKISLAFRNPETSDQASLSFKGFTLTSKNPTILSARSDGTIKGLKAGTATLKLASSTCPSLSTQFKIKVTDPNARSAKLSANGGSFSKTSRITSKTLSVTYGKKYGHLPLAYRKGYAFKGWYTKKSGGSRILSTSKVTIARGKTQMLYARWSKVTVKKPVSVKAKKQASTKISVSWKKISGVKGYEILCSTSRKFPNSSTRKITVSSAKSSAVFDKLKKGTTYYFKVRAYKTDSMDKKVYGSYSSTVSLKR